MLQMCCRRVLLRIELPVLQVRQLPVRLSIGWKFRPYSAIKMVGSGDRPQALAAGPPAAGHFI